MAKKRELRRIPLREQIADILEKEIRTTFQPGDRLPSETKLASRFGVSTLTLREALASLAEMGLVERRHGKGTFVRDPHRGQHLAVLIELDLSNPNCSPFWPRVVQGLRRHFDAQGVPNRAYIGHWVPGETPRAEGICREFEEDIDANRIRGVVVLAYSQEPGWVDVLKQRQVPIVGDDPHFEHRVLVDLQGMASQGLQHLKQQGCERIAVLASFMNDEDLPPLFAAEGLAYDPARVRTDFHPAYLGQAYTVFSDIWNGTTPRPDGLLILDDFAFQEAATVLLESGAAVPGDIRIATHANRGTRTFFPFPVDLMEFDPDGVARTMGDLLLRLLEDETNAPCEIRVPFAWRHTGPGLMDISATSDPAVPAPDA